MVLSYIGADWVQRIPLSVYRPLLFKQTPREMLFSTRSISTLHPAPSFESMLTGFPKNISWS